MSSQNGTTHTDSPHHLLEDQLDALKAGVRKLMDRVATKPADAPPSRISTFTGKATELIKAHPIAAVGIALGLGYVVMRIARR